MKAKRLTLKSAIASASKTASIGDRFTWDYRSRKLKKLSPQDKGWNTAEYVMSAHYS